MGKDESVPFCATMFPAVTFTGGVPDDWTKDTSSNVWGSKVTLASVGIFGTKEIQRLTWSRRKIALTFAESNAALTVARLVS